MLTPEESAALLDINQRLRKLHTQKAEAQRVRDRACAEALQAQIDELNDDRDIVLDAADAA